MTALSPHCRDWLDALAEEGPAMDYAAEILARLDECDRLREGVLYLSALAKEEGATSVVQAADVILAGPGSEGE